MEAKGRLSVRLLVVVLRLKMLPAVPVETVAMMLLSGKAETERFLLASVTTREEAVKVAMLTLPLAVTWKSEEPEEELTLKGLSVPEP